MTHDTRISQFAVQFQVLDELASTPLHIHSADVRVSYRFLTHLGSDVYFYRFYFYQNVCTYIFHPHQNHVLTTLGYYRIHVRGLVQK